MELNTPIQTTKSQTRWIRNLSSFSAVLAWTTTMIVAPYAAQAGNGTQSDLSRNTKPDVIYGEDDRKDLYQITDQFWYNLSRSTVGLFQKRNVRVRNGVAQLATTIIGEEYNLCRDEPFWSQSSGAFCSGTLVAPDLVLTAGHCITSASDCRNTALVFDFAVFDQRQQQVTQVAAGGVYDCASIVQQHLDDSGEDWALVRLDRPVVDRSPLPISRTNVLTNGTPLVMVGHPSGLPTKIAGGAWVRDDSNPYYIVANTDSYGGNSGSGVFNAQTGELEGILVRGHDDYEHNPDQNCTRSVHCTDDGCRGEDITRVTMAASFIPSSSTPTTPGTMPGTDPGWGWQPTPDPGYSPTPDPGYGWIP